MKIRRQKCAIVVVTAPSMRVARKLARLCVAARLAACVNLVPGIESHYTWKSKVEQGREVLMIFKTTGDCLNALEKAVLQHHPYDTPEFVVLDIAAGNGRYLDWVTSSVRAVR